MATLDNTITVFEGDKLLKTLRLVNPRTHATAPLQPISASVTAASLLVLYAPGQTNERDKSNTAASLTSGGGELTIDDDAKTITVAAAHGLTAGYYEWVLGLTLDDGHGERFSHQRSYFSFAVLTL